MKKWIWSIVAALSCLIIILLLFYFSTIEDYDDAERSAIKWTLELTSMTEVDHVEFFAGETNYTIVFGINSDGEKLIVWVSDEQIHEEKESDGFARSTIRKLVIEREGPVSFVHITPGKDRKSTRLNSSHV